MIEDIWLRCRSCARSWMQAQIDPGAWWSEGVTPEKIARQVGSCPHCGARSLEVVSEQQSLTLETQQP